MGHAWERIEVGKHRNRRSCTSDLHCWNVILGGQNFDQVQRKRTKTLQSRRLTSLLLKETHSVQHSPDLAVQKDAGHLRQTESASQFCAVGVIWGHGVLNMKGSLGFELGDPARCKFLESRRLLKGSDLDCLSRDLLN
jgi:hypothetical protein